MIAVAGVLGTVLSGMYAFQRSLIYHPAGGPVPPADEVLPGGSDVTLTTADGLELSAWYVPATHRDENTAPTVLFAPGNGGNRAGRADLAADLSADGHNVLLLDYRGYADNPGDPSESGLAHDVRAARQYLVDERGVSPRRLLYFGESIGCGPISDLATEHPPAGMLLRSPFVDLPAVAGKHYPFLPVRALLKDRYPVADNLRGLSGVEVTVVYGTADSIVPAEQSREVAHAADASTVELAGLDHNDADLVAGPTVVRAVGDLARRAGIGDGA